MPIPVKKLELDSRPFSLREWDDAGTLLANALANYLKFSIFLETSRFNANDGVVELVDCIDSSLQTLHKTLEQQLHQSRVSLTRARNRLASPIYCFPEEILSEIFCCAVFNPDDDHLSCPTQMGSRVRTIYQRLYNLMSVCTIWRNVGLNRSDFWSIIPMVDGISNGWRSLSVQLSVQRSAHRDLHLTVDANLLCACIRKNDFKLLHENMSRIRSLNIRSEYPQDIPYVLATLLDHNVAESLSRLSICYGYRDPTEIYRGGPNELYVTQLFGPVHPQFPRLMSSLSAFRISNVPFVWKYATFSTRLVDLRVDRVELSGDSAITSFLAALSSAQELRNLTIITLEASADHDSTLPRLQLLLPKLEVLYLENLYFNVLELLLAALTPRSYRLTLNLSDLVTQKLFANSDVGEVSLREVNRVLSHYPVDKLVLAGDIVSFWETTKDLHKLLSSLPTLKTLILNCYELDSKLMKALEPPPTTRNIPFPKLEAIEFRSCTIRGRLTGLKNLVTKHPIRRLVLGQNTWLSGSNGMAVKLEEENAIVRWLKYNVFGFQFIQHESDAPEYSDVVWQLWDL